MSESVLERRWQLAARLTAAAFVWSLGLLLAALLLPAYDDQTITNANGLTLTTATFVQVNGAWVLLPIALPAVASVVVALALRANRLRGPTWAGAVAWVMIGLLAILALLSILTIGVFILPAVVLLGLGLRLADRPRGAPATGVRDAHGPRAADGPQS